MCQEILSFEQLSSRAKDNAVEQFSSFWSEGNWYETVFEDAKQIGALMGIEIDRIGFSGFSCQGDGAHFEGSFSYEKNALKNVKQYAPLDKDLHSIVEDYTAIQRKVFYKLVGKVVHSGHYEHSGCTNISVEHADDYYRDIGSLDQEMTEVLRRFMDWIYKELEADYEASTSEEAASEYYNDMSFTFDEQGKILH